MNYRRFMALLLTGVLAAGLAAAPAQVWAEESGEGIVQEKAPEEKTGGEKAPEEKKEAVKEGEAPAKAPEEEKKQVPAETPAEKTEEESEEKKEETVKEPAEDKEAAPAQDEALSPDTVSEDQPDGQKEDVPEDLLEEAPEEAPAEELAESPAEGVRFLGAEPGDPEEEEEEDPEEEEPGEEEEDPGEDDTGGLDEEPYYEYYDELSDIEVVPGGEDGVYLGGLCAVLYGGESDGEEFPLTVTGAVIDDPSVAEIRQEDQGLYVKGKSTGSARVTVTYQGPEGEGTTGFNVSVKETVYRIYMDVPESDGYLKPESSTGLKLSVESMTAGDDDYKPVEEKDVTVVWSNEADRYEDAFDLKGSGFSATLDVGQIPGYETVRGHVLAEVYLGSDVSEENMIGSGEFSYAAGDHYYAWDVDIYADEWELFDDPASESVITVSTNEDRELSVKKWVAVELGEDEERLGILDYPFEDSGSPLSTTVNGQVLAGLVGIGRDVEFFAVVNDEDGMEAITDSVYISVRSGEAEVSCSVDSVNLLPGEKYSEPVSVTAYVVNMEYPEGEEIDCEIMGAEAEDPSIAEVSFEDGMLYVKGIKTGTTQAYLKYIGPDGEEGQCPFTVTVAEAIYYVYIDDSYEEYPMLNGDRADLKVSVYRYAKEGDDTDFTELDDDEIEVVWQLESADEGIPVTDFTLETDGSAATLYVTGEVDIEEETQTALVRARVYLKGTDEEIGSGEIEHYHLRSGDFLIVEDTLPDDELEVGESFTITPCVLRRQETGDGEVSTKREERAYFGLIFDPAQVRVTDQNGQEVEPAEDGDYYGLVDCQSDGTVYTVTRLSAENIEVSLAAIWPEVEGADLDFATVNWKKFYLGSLDEDEPNEPESGNETSPQGGSGKDKSNSTPASTGKSGKASSSSKSAKTGGTTKTSRTARKTATGDPSDAMLWIILMTATAAACAAAAGSLRKRAR
ncbi:MAG: hypothetical protein IKI23_07030 [Lachnospiraceae bacterium]|nr:hypothetical protein [Lachnospiraceae bacterium]